MLGAMAQAKRHLEDRRKQFDTAERQEHHWKNRVERGEAVIPQKARRLTAFTRHRHIDQSNTDSSADESDKKFKDHYMLPTHYKRSAGSAGSQPGTPISIQGCVEQ
jgi:hypothetical protein